MLRCAALLLTFTALIPAQPRVDAARVAAIVQKASEQGRIPGVAVAIITPEGDFVHGYGVRNLETRQPVTEHTAFDLGSVTKSVTALGAAIMVDAGKLDWDRPVREYIPWFRLYDPVASDLTTIRDLLTHRSGLPRYDFLRFAVPLSREELVRRLRYLPPTATFRERYQYQNLMYTAAGYLAGVADGTSWEELTEKHIFGPLGMRDSSTRVTELKRSADFASPHERVDGVLRPMEFYDYQTFGVGPNGAVNSSAADMVRYLRFHMGDGTLGGKRILSRRQFNELHRPQMVIDEATSYALGWIVDWSPGFKVVSHGGAITGFSAYAAFAPGRQEGVAVMTNSPGTAPPIALTVMKEVLGWKPGALPLNDGTTISAARPPAVDGPPARPLAAYAGRYTHPAFGPCEVSESGSQLMMKFPAVTYSLRHVRFDTFDAGSSIEVQFFLDTRGTVSRLEARIEPSAPAVPFRRVE